MMPMDQAGREAGEPAAAGLSDVDCLGLFPLVPLLWQRGPHASVHAVPARTLQISFCSCLLPFGPRSYYPAFLPLLSSAGTPGSH